MRRKTKAKRVLDPGNEEEKQQEDDEEEGGEGEETEHGLQLKRRKQMQAARERADGNSSPAAGLHKPRMEVYTDQGFDLEANNPDNLSDCDSTREESDYLQSRPKSELIAMVLCMQREMEGLREQIRCLTACGKLARNIEALIEKTQTWVSGDDSKQDVQTDGQQALIPYAMPAAVVVNGQWVEQASPGEGVLTEPRQEPQRKGLYVLPEYITQDLLDHCNTTSTAQKLTNDLLRGLYERECLASHSISGIVYNKKGCPKPALPADEVQAVLRTVQHFFPGKTDAEIKGYIRQKLQNEAKRLRRKPQPPEIKDS
ncbi:uncharacterized protein si:ch211-194k22.8 isoform X3 [Acipenser ruthenus]|uniref:uncharacterized protein si:ch211-194k22.8 isoform X3 n=1 Tax=Acipenser ruthenus TaxID=7906 RepID=UPI00145AF3F2|nr:uncharacterized protein si:ch211-194k22.8 isoform X3 [Acipenser ruthenus]